MKRLNEILNSVEQFLVLEEYYSIEDYGSLLSVQTCLQSSKSSDFFLFNSCKNDELEDKSIRVNFEIDGVSKEVLIEKALTKKIYKICKIYSENNKFIKILVNRAEKYDTNEILKKINELKMFKGALRIHLNLDEFPIKTYYLEEREFQNNEIEKEFILKKINSNINQNININNRAQINNNNIQANNYNVNQNYNLNQINFNQNFCNNNNINNDNFNNNQIIQNNLENNKLLLQIIINYIQQNKNNNDQMNFNLLRMINNLIQINNNILNDFNNMNSMRQNIVYLINLIKNNYMLQMNNNNQMNNNMPLIINCLNQIYNNINYIMNLSNNNFCQIDKSNNYKNNKGNNDKINRSDNEKNQKNNVEGFMFKEFENYFPLIGLKNVGQICYMNSILQCLLHIPQLNGFFINKYPEEKNKLKIINNDTETEGRLCEEYHKIVMDIYKQDPKKSYISPKDFNTFLRQINGNFEEVNVKEFLTYLFQIMHAELNYKGNQKLKNVPKCNQIIEKESFDFFMAVSNNLNLSIISYLFYGILKSTTICKSCHNIFYNFQYFQTLSFPTFNFKDKSFNIYQGFKEFIKPNIMSGEDKCYCQKCKGLRDMNIKNKIYFSPPYLIIHLDYGENKKYKPKEVLFGGIIDISGFVDKYDREPSIQYKLKAVCSHIGKSENSGNYITYCQNNEDKWYEFNDSSVTEITFDKLNSNSPYILIYKKL